MAIVIIILLASIRILQLVSKEGKKEEDGGMTYITYIADHRYRNILCLDGRLRRRHITQERIPCVLQLPPFLLIASGLAGGYALAFLANIGIFVNDPITGPRTSLGQRCRSRGVQRGCPISRQGGSR